MNIRLAETDVDLELAFPVVQELRPHLDAEAFRAAVRRQQAQGYHLAMLVADSEVRSVAGYRVFETLAWGRVLYVDDLVTRQADKGTGYGSRLFDWLIAEARRQGCAGLHLDSGVQRYGAHRFYLHKGLDITSHHFALKL